VDAVHERSISDEDTGVAMRPVGTDGGVLSTLVVVSDSVKELVAARAVELDAPIIKAPPSARMSEAMPIGMMRFMIFIRESR
jgi:hypothetical protein